MIEKDEEQAIEVGDDVFMPADSVKRQYIPIRDTYIRIVKSCRKLCIDSMERRSRKDMKKTIKNLQKIAKVQKQLLREEQRQIQFY